MITCFSFKLNGWVNYRYPNTPTPATIARGRAISFPLATPDGFAYKWKKDAENQTPESDAFRAKPRDWAKHLPKTDYAK